MSKPYANKSLGKEFKIILIFAVLFSDTLGLKLLVNIIDNVKNKSLLYYIL